MEVYDVLAVLVIDRDSSLLHFAAFKHYLPIAIRLFRYGLCLLWRTGLDCEIIDHRFLYDYLVFAHFHQDNENRLAIGKDDQSLDVICS